MTRSEIAEAMFGAFDGVTCLLGVAFAAAMSGHQAAIPAAGIGLALSEGVAMSGAAFLAGHGLRKTGIMAAAVALSIALPTLPFFLLGGSAAVIGCAAVAAGISLLIARYQDGRMRYARTFGIISIAVALAVFAGMVIK